MYGINQQGLGNKIAKIIGFTTHKEITNITAAAATYKKITNAAKLKAHKWHAKESYVLVTCTVEPEHQHPNMLCFFHQFGLIYTGLVSSLELRQILYDNIRQILL